MRARYKTVLFDLDGTLLDSLADLTASVNHILCKRGYPTRTEREVRTFIGNGVVHLLTRSLPAGKPQAEIDECVRDFKAHYDLHMRDRTAPFAGIMTLLDDLLAAGCQLGVVSNKMDPAVKSLCAEWFGARLSAAIGERAGVRRKPAPDTLLCAMSELGADPATTVYVGDGETDVQTAQAADVACISVTWGYRDRAQLAEAGATVFAETPEALRAQLLEDENEDLRLSENHLA